MSRVSTAQRTLAGALLGLTLVSQANPAFAASFSEGAPSTATSTVTNTASGSAKESVAVDNSAIEKAVADAQRAGVQVTQNSTEAMNVSRADVPSALKTISSSYEEQIKALEEATAKATAQNEAYQSELAQYNADKAQYDADKSAYDTAKAQYDAEQAQYQSALAQYQAEKATYDSALAQYQADKAKYDEEVVAYNAAKAEFDEKNAQYLESKERIDSLYNQQVNNADPSVAQRVTELAYLPSFTINDNRNALVESPGYEFTNFDNYNSDRVLRIDNPGNFTAKWNDVATSTDGRAINATIDFSNFVKYSGYDGNRSTDPAYVLVFSNFIDNIAMFGYTNIDQTITYYYADTGEKVPANVYTTFGSLNAQGFNGERFEYANYATTDSAIATFIHQDSMIKDTKQATFAVGDAFMVDQASNQQMGISDNSPEALTKLGVTFLTQNGATFRTGTTGANGTEPSEVPADNVTGNNEKIWATYNHVMMASSTVAPVASVVKPVEPTPPTAPNEPVAPTEPTPPTTVTPPAAPPTPPTPPTEPAPVTASYNLFTLDTEKTVTTKVAHGEDRKVLQGEKFYQTVTGITPFAPLTQWAIGDAIMYPADGALKADVNYDEITVTDSEGNDVSDLFDFTYADNTIDGKKVLEVLATAKNPASLPANTTYNLNVSQTAHVDGTIDDHNDFGFTIENGERQITEVHTYNEYIPDPKKSVTTDAGIDADGKSVLPGQTLHYQITLPFGELNNTQQDIQSLQTVDSYDTTYFQPTGGDVILDSEGNDVTDQFVITLDESSGKASVTPKDIASVVGKDYVWTFKGKVRDDAKPGTFNNIAALFVNDVETKTNQVTNEVPPVNPHKYDTSPVDGSNIDGKTVVVGDVLRYALALDASELDNQAYPITKLGMRDDYAQEFGDALEESVKVYKVSANADLSTPENTMNALRGKTVLLPTDGSGVSTDGTAVTPESADSADSAVNPESTDSAEFTDSAETSPSTPDTAPTTPALGDNEAVDVTADWEVSDDGDNLFIMSKTGEDGTVTAELGVKYIITFDYKVTENTEGSIPNTAYQIVNDNEFETETVVNHLKQIDPTKDVTIEVGGASVDGSIIELNTQFNYQLNSSTLPADRATFVENYTITDQFDTKHDEYNGFKAVSRFDIPGTDIKAGDDISQYIVETNESGKVTYSLNEEFMAMISTEEARSVEFGWTVYSNMTRIAPGDVENTFTENLNGEDLTSNTVVTHTPEPPAPETPSPETPVIQEVLNPVAQPAPAQPAQPAQPLIQSGILNSDGSLTALGMMLVASGALVVVGGGIYLLKNRRQAQGQDAPTAS